MSSAARSPNPFFSVLTISILPYSRRWNLVGWASEEWRHHDETPHAPLVRAVSAAFAVFRKTLHLSQTIDAIIDANFLWAGVRTPSPSRNGGEMWWDSPKPSGGHSQVMLSSASLLRPRVEY